MQDHAIYQADLARGSVNPTFVCGHCQSTLSRSRIFRNEGANRFDVACQTIGLCSADDCGALNCCDAAVANLDNPAVMDCIAS